MNQIASFSPESNHLPTPEFSQNRDCTQARNMTCFNFGDARAFRGDFRLRQLFNYAKVFRTMRDNGDSPQVEPWVRPNWPHPGYQDKKRRLKSHSTD